MTQPFLAEIRMFAGNFAPRGWALCNGQILSISQNTALFSLLGTTYGGNGTSNFALPNLQSSAPMHAGQGPGLTNHVLGEASGTPTVTLLATGLASHTHSLQGSTALASSTDPSAGVYAEGRHTGSPAGPAWPYSTLAPDANLNPTSLGQTGGNQPHNNLMPYLTLNFIIALQGIYPARN
jgi:microcystin-dependent protein